LGCVEAADERSAIDAAAKEFRDQRQSEKPDRRGAGRLLIGAPAQGNPEGEH